MFTYVVYESGSFEFTCVDHCVWLLVGLDVLFVVVNCVSLEIIPMVTCSDIHHRAV